MKYVHYMVAVLITFVLPSLQDQDDVTDFCRRFGQQTAVVDRRLYIDGGMVQYQHDDSNYTNEVLLYNDLDNLGDDGLMPQLHVDLRKDNSVPKVSGGALWSDKFNKTLYLYGGEFYDSRILESSLWRYNITSDTWDSIESNARGTPQRLAWGASTVVEDRFEGYWFGGWQNNATTPNWQGGPRASSQMLKYYMDDNRWTNYSGPDTKGRAEGAMVYLPASDAGLLVYFGGIVDPYQNGTVLAENMSLIHIYDIQSSKWYIQNATGEIPESRRRFCAGVTWAKDQSSYNIYLYGGASVGEGPGFDDVYILTMPSFRWIKWWAADPAPGRPHHSLSCNIVSSAQMLIIGGAFPLETSGSCDSPEVLGTHNLKLGGGNDWVEWKPYDPNLTDYLVPSNITGVIGGGPEGGATLTAPPSWNNKDLQTYFNLKVSPKPMPTSEPTPQSGGSKLSTGSIVGIAIGSFIFFAIIVVCAYVVLRRRSRPRTHRVELPASPATAVPNGYHGAVLSTSSGPNSPMHPMEVCNQEPSELDSPAYHYQKTTAHHTTASFPTPGHFREELDARNGPVEMDTYTSTESGHGQWTWSAQNSPMGSDFRR